MYRKRIIHCFLTVHHILLLGLKRIFISRCGLLFTRDIKFHTENSLGKFLLRNKLKPCHRSQRPLSCCFVYLSRQFRQPLGTWTLSATPCALGASANRFEIHTRSCFPVLCSRPSWNCRPFPWRDMTLQITITENRLFKWKARKLTHSSVI